MVVAPVRSRRPSRQGAGARNRWGAWSAGGDRHCIRVRDREQRIVTFAADGAPSTRAGPLDASWDRVDLEAVSLGDVALLSDPSTIARTRLFDHRNLIRE